MRPAVAWIVPDLAFATATITLFYCLFLFQGYQRLFRDSDAGWHIRAGEAILETSRLPRTDPYSFSRPGAPWFAWEWCADVAAGALHHLGGLRAVALFYGAVIAAGVWLWFRLHWALHGDFLTACAMSPLLLSTCNIHWLARPHVIGWLFLVGAVLYAETGRVAFTWRSAAAVALFTALWANVHASFFLAAVIAGAYALGRMARGEPARWWTVPVCLAAPLANPYGWHLYSHVYRYLTDSELLARIGEFQSFDFHTPGSGQIIATVLLGIAGGTLALTLKRYEHFLLALLISAMALRSARALPLSALLLLPVANSAITATWTLPWKSYAARLRLLDARGTSPKDRLQTEAAPQIQSAAGFRRGLAWVPVVLLAAWTLLRVVPVGFPPSDFPVAAYPHIPAGARLFAPDKFGGYLIYRSNGSQKVFFDGRSDFYGAEFLKQYSRLVQVRPGWRESWDSFQFTHALIPVDYPLVPALQQLGWQTVYRDGTAILLAKEGT